MWRAPTTKVVGPPFATALRKHDVDQLRLAADLGAGAAGDQLQAHDHLGRNALELLGDDGLGAGPLAVDQHVAGGGAEAAAVVAVTQFEPRHPRHHVGGGHRIVGLEVVGVEGLGAAAGIGAASEDGLEGASWAKAGVARAVASAAQETVRAKAPTRVTVFIAIPPDHCKFFYELTVGVSACGVNGYSGAGFEGALDAGRGDDSQGIDRPCDGVNWKAGAAPSRGRCP